MLIFPLSTKYCLATKSVKQATQQACKIADRGLVPEMTSNKAVVVNVSVDMESLNVDDVAEELRTEWAAAARELIPGLVTDEDVVVEVSV